jgi:hypothetical protein
VPAYQTDQLMLWRNGQSHAGGPWNFAAQCGGDADRGIEVSTGERTEG